MLLDIKKVKQTSSPKIYHRSERIFLLLRLSEAYSCILGVTAKEKCKQNKSYLMFERQRNLKGT